MAVPKYNNFHCGDDEVAVDERMRGYKLRGVSFTDCELLALRKTDCLIQIDCIFAWVPFSAIADTELVEVGDVGEVTICEETAIDLGLV